MYCTVRHAVPARPGRAYTRRVGVISRIHVYVYTEGRRYIGWASLVAFSSVRCPGTECQGCHWFLHLCHTCVYHVYMVCMCAWVRVHFMLSVSACSTRWNSTSVWWPSSLTFSSVRRTRQPWRWMKGGHIARCTSSRFCIVFFFTSSVEREIFVIFWKWPFVWFWFCFY